LKDARDKLGSEISFALVFASTSQPLGELSAALSAGLPHSVLLGASTSGEFTEQGDAKNSVALFAVAGDFRVFAGIGTGLKRDPERAVSAALEGLRCEVHGYPCRTAIMLLDPLAGRGEEATLLAATLLGDDVRLAGGAAGDDLQMRATTVSCGPRAASDAVAIALVFSRVPLGVGVCHGHEPLSPPLRVTKASEGTVQAVDGKPAWQVWTGQTSAKAPLAKSRFLMRRLV
jgi:methyl-accepting chemotaxis protein